MTDTNNEKGGSPDTDRPFLVLIVRGACAFSEKTIPKYEIGGSYESGFCIKHVQGYAV